MAAQTFTQEFGYRLGRGLRRAGSGYLRYECQATGWLSGQCVPAALTTSLLWGVKLALLGAVLYVAFWLAILVAVVMLAAVWADQHLDLDWTADEPEWKEGHSGFGLYDKSEWRIDMPGPDEI